MVAVAPGLYEVSFGFYPAPGAPRVRRSMPLVQLLVNGEVALTAVQNPHAIQHAPGGGGGGASGGGGGYGGGLASPSASVASGTRSPRMGSYNSPGVGGHERATSTTGLVASNVTGVTTWDVLLLPAKAKLAVTYQGDERGEGFLGLRKL